MSGFMLTDLDGLRAKSVFIMYEQGRRQKSVMEYKVKDLKEEQCIRHFIISY